MSTTEFFTAQPPLVSFVVPTLNRGKYVLRAVRSCLNNDDKNVCIEVVVIDSSSKDGSYEDLQKEFSDDIRVKLLQNPSGSGPIKSWLEGVESISGDYFTFVWSDDLISPLFLKTLLKPLLDSQADVAIGFGKNEILDEELDFSHNSGQFIILDRREILLQYYRISLSKQSHPIIVSPTCSLFSAKDIQPWVAGVMGYCQKTSIRKEIMWQSAIGPDLMLYLSSFSPGHLSVALTEKWTAQFSIHPDSISIESDPCRLQIGYWLARAWYIEANSKKESPSFLAQLFGAHLLRGLVITIRCIWSADGRCYLFRFLKELFIIAHSAWRHNYFLSGMGIVFVEGLRIVGQRLFKLLRKNQN
ncbi:MAG: glycosyltransferase family 2 protein [Candidatus Marinimicrobia bacterium]|jgi:glycosyltransferase involved in cell wall biosynthesis|nr:glycosyltransferase family 2 protein [Candidatus Neomarinimicrobiota bacterium]